jgi:hypothetical protein
MRLAGRAPAIQEVDIDSRLMTLAVVMLSGRAIPLTADGYAAGVSGVRAIAALRAARGGAAAAGVPVGERRLGERRGDVERPEQRATNDGRKQREVKNSPN